VNIIVVIGMLEVVKVVSSNVDDEEMGKLNVDETERVLKIQ
jgi:hypothetical protein